MATVTFPLMFDEDLILLVLAPIFLWRVRDLPRLGVLSLEMSKMLSCVLLERQVTTRSWTLQRLRKGWRTTGMIMDNKKECKVWGGGRKPVLRKRMMLWSVEPLCRLYFFRRVKADLVYINGPS